jgi:dynein assembly factor 1
MQLEKELDEEEAELNNPKSLRSTITREVLAKVLKGKEYFQNEEFNSHLVLQNYGFDFISNLERFTGLKVLYLHNNCITRISGLSSLRQLASLYLQGNLIRKIQGLGDLKELRNLNLGENLIERVEHLELNPKLEFLILSHNKIGKNGLSDVEGLQAVTSLTSLDLSSNQLKELGENNQQFLDVLCSLEQLGALYLAKNPFCQTMEAYRKRLISGLRHLRYLDDLPVFEDERRLAEAYVRGGAEEVSAEKSRLIQEEKLKKQTRMADFDSLIKNKELKLQKLREEEEKIRREAEEYERQIQQMRDLEERALLNKKKGKLQYSKTLPEELLFPKK